MSFSLFPPEINSALMFSGAGSGPLLEASTAWSELAADLESTATQYQTLVTNLVTGSWLGPSSAQMASATAPYIAWLQGTRGHRRPNRRPGPGSRRGLSNRLCLDGAAARDRCQPGRVGDLSGQQLPRPEHRGDRHQRSQLPGHVDPGRAGHGHLPGELPGSQRPARPSRRPPGGQRRGTRSRRRGSRPGRRHQHGHPGAARRPCGALRRDGDDAGPDGLDCRGVDDLARDGGYFGSRESHGRAASGAGHLLRGHAGQHARTYVHELGQLLGQQCRRLHAWPAAPTP